ncbi:MAG TPA: iron hydrogenase small subunit, partial [Spirochaetota bacterium]|nr:iron hydrogenase small subunit [Spirochaetota bacterium]
PGGCVGGGGQPYPHQGEYTIDFDLYRKRAGALYAIDKDKELRKSHKNPHVLELYKDYLGEVGGHRAHELLHTHYQVRAPRGI